MDEIIINKVQKYKNAENFLNFQTKYQQLLYTYCTVHQKRITLNYQFSYNRRYKLTQTKNVNKIYSVNQVCKNDNPAHRIIIVEFVTKLEENWKNKRVNTIFISFQQTRPKTNQSLKRISTRKF
eukprot:TRINITY_DN3934_c0_g1_i2.p3 TRINITY_DN3934_c0_g1~~TRINITY_DN3934_c0_g1_i2.p3  ORF type:complete len:124 (-),score=0.63 TRINITY_DN3934_c0_g1_i2:380-751(-)